MAMASSAAIAYSPVGPLALTTFDESSLKELKYHQLLKLASNHNVLKRWSKKASVSALFCSFHFMCLPYVGVLYYVSTDLPNIML